MNSPGYEREAMRKTQSPGDRGNSLSRKIRSISNTLYNKGLVQAKNGDLSGAVASLTKSLQFNRGNYNARNVLGLTYYALGRAGDAVKQWVISVNLAKENNAAKDYIKTLEQNASEMERLNDSIKMYNQALVYVRQKSEDMAVIQLKKALDLNPCFADAMNLLTLCYLIQKDSKKAAAVCERVLAIDMHNPVALHYYRELNPDKPLRVSDTAHIRTVQGRGAEAKTATARTAAVPRIDLHDKRAFGRNNHMSAVIAFIIGTVSSFLVIYLLLMPSAMNAKNDQIDKLTAEYTQKAAQDADQIAAHEAAIDALTLEKEALTETNTQLQSQVDLQNRTQTVLTAASLLAEGDGEGAVKLLETFNPNGLATETIDLYNSTRASAYATLESDAFAEGKRLYNNWKNEEAKPFFETAIKYATPDSAITGDAYYYLGRIAQAAGDLPGAKNYYEKVVNEYKNTSFLRDATWRLSQVQ